MKKIFILNGVGTSGKGVFAEFVNKYIPTHKYSIAELPKKAAKILGWDGESKTEKDRKFLSDIVDLSTEYSDAPFKDVESLVIDFKNNPFGNSLMLIDMRDPKDITRAVKTFGAQTLLIRNPRVKQIESNHADRNVENYEYDYIIENNGTLAQLDAVAKEFVELITEACVSFPKCAYCIHNPKSKKETVVFECNKMVEG